MIFPIPIYRFFDKKKYLDEFVYNGIMRFNPVSAFTELSDVKYRDEGEKYYKIKTVQQEEKIINGKKVVIGGSITHQYRKINDAWAFCATTSIVSNARKPFSGYIKNLGRLVFELEKAIRLLFDEDLIVMMGPIAYYNKDLDTFSEVIQPPYFCKTEKFKLDLEFRIVIIPSNKIYEKGKLTALELKLENPQEIFGKTLILENKN
ncbi:hypothetical protein PG910_07040 [Tenacibaculum dicentrarchi]|nr:hypothetical protein PG910_07040 [Tenacibaculum dicentrarchi]